MKTTTVISRIYNLNTLYISLIFAIDLIRKTSVLKVYKTLTANQFRPPEECQKTLAFDKKLYIENVLNNTDIFKTTTCISSIEPIDKQLIKKKYSSYINRSPTTKVLKRFTGGSTGEPFEYLTTPLAQSYLWAGIFLSWQAAGYKLGDRVVFIGGGSILGKKNIKKTLFFRAQNIHTIDTFEEKSIGQNLSPLKILKIKPKFIYGYAGSIASAAAEIIKSGTSEKFRFVKGIITTAEVLTDKMRSDIKAAFNCDVFNQYGSNDAGVSAFECEEHSGLHIITDRCFLETDENSELLATDLKNHAMGIARYRFGDLGELSDEPCSCGRGYPLIKNLKGRMNDTITLQSGRKVHASYFSFFLKKETTIERYQIIKSNNLIEINIIGADPDTHQALQKNYLQKLKSELDSESINMVFDKPVEKTNSNKFRFVIDKDKFQAQH